MNEKKSNFYPDMARPFIVLVVICLVAAGLLGFVNAKTAPIIEANALAAAEQARRDVLPTATGFDELEVTDELAALGVTGIYKDQGGSGYVVTASNKGYGGDVSVTVGFDAEGSILDLQVDVSSETKGVGSKLADSEYVDKFKGLSCSSDEVDLSSGATAAGNADGIELRSGATFTSNAFRGAVNAAMAAVESVK